MNDELAHRNITDCGSVTRVGNVIFWSVKVQKKYVKIKVHVMDGTVHCYSQYRELCIRTEIDK